MNLLLLAIAPIAIILVYIYYRDKYEKEPIALLLKSLLAGGFIVIPILFAEEAMNALLTPLNTSNWSSAFNTAFGVAALCEESFKFLAIMLLVWRNKNFNERFDGIVYAVFVSLGFALVENIMYVFSSDNGIYVGSMRAFTAVPAHAMFGIMMGFHLGLARFIPGHRSFHLFNALLVPIIFHGVYDFILMAQSHWLLLMYIPLLIVMLVRVKKRLLQHSDNSVFKQV